MWVFFSSVIFQPSTGFSLFFLSVIFQSASNYLLLSFLLLASPVTSHSLLCPPAVFSPTYMASLPSVPPVHLPIHASWPLPFQNLILIADLFRPLSFTSTINTSLQDGGHWANLFNYRKSIIPQVMQMGSVIRCARHIPYANHCQRP